MAVVSDLICNIDACPRPVFVLKYGFCQRHYNAMRERGGPLNSSTFRPDWSIEQFCKDCSVPLVKGTTKTIPDGMARHAARGRCDDCHRPFHKKREAVGNFDCVRCFRNLLDNDFKRYPDGMYSRVCKVCAWLYPMGLLYSSFLIVWEGQGGKCKICSTYLIFGGGHYEKPCLDHDHTCCDSKKAPKCGKCFRAILCNGCNSGLGQFKENKQSLINAAKYLEEFDGKH
jgi:hypothetical protein